MSEQTNVRLSVVIPCYDEGELLHDAVRSAYRQKTEMGEAAEYEVILVPDHGADEITEAVASELTDRHSTLRLVPNRRSGGAPGARNTGIEAARGEWIAFLDADDLWFENAIEVRFRLVDHWPDARWLTTDFVRSYPSRDADPVRYTESSPAARRIVGEALEKNAAICLERPVAEFNQAILCHTNAVTVRKSLLKKVGGFSEDLKRCEDIHLWFRLAANADLVFTPDVTAHYRLRSSSVQNRGDTPWGWDIRAAKDLMRKPALEPWRETLARGRLRWVLNNQTEYFREQEEYLSGAGTALQSIRHHPWQKRAWKDLLACIVGRS